MENENISIIKADITSLACDAIVNAANDKLKMGGGVCGAIFKAAGMLKLSRACKVYKNCSTGNAVITPGFNLKAQYIIHAVGPIWHGGDRNEEVLLYNAYYNSLSLAKEYACTSIAFPLISAGIYGYPKESAWQIAIKACKDFVESNLDYHIEIFFAILDDSIIELGKSYLSM